MTMAFTSFKQKKLLSKHVGSVSRARWTEDGKYVITCGHDKTLRLWNPFRAESEDHALHIKLYEGVHHHEVLDVAIFKDNSSFVSCGGDKECFLWDVTEGRILRRFEGHAQRVNAVALNREDNLLVSGSYDQTVRLWDMRSRSRDPIQILNDCKDSVSSVDVSTYEVVTGSVDGCIRTYDLRTAQCHSDKISKPITNVCISHDSRCIIASVLGGAVALVDKSSGNILHTYQGHQHDSYSMQSSLTFNDAHIISGSEDGVAYVYDLLSGDVVDKLVAHNKAVIGVAAHPKEMKLITSSLDGTSILWEMSE